MFVSAPVEEGGSGEGGGRKVSLGVLARAGVYRSEGASEGDRVVAVNLLDPGVSALETADSIDVGGGRATSGAGSAESGAVEEVWVWFALAALAALTLEWFLFAWRMRV